MTEKTLNKIEMHLTQINEFCKTSPAVARNVNAIRSLLKSKPEPVAEKTEAPAPVAEKPAKKKTTKK